MVKKIALVACLSFFFLARAFAENKIETEDIAHCRTEAEVAQAKGRGAAYLEINGWYFARVGKEYKGPFRSLDQARAQRQKNIPGTPEGQVSSGKTEKDQVIYNPLLMMYPFVEVVPDKGVFFSIPSGITVAASQVMIHQEPLLFDEVSYGAIDLKEKGRYFAITGKVAARPNVVLATPTLTFWIGASVLGQDGSLLWRHYGPFEKDMGFKCVYPIEKSPLTPKYLLLFTIAAGKIPRMLSAAKDAPVYDSSSYAYHILCSSTFDVSPNWYAPLDDTIKEEYEKMLKSSPQRRLPPLGKSR